MDKLHQKKIRMFHAVRDASNYLPPEIQDELETAYLELLDEAIKVAKSAPRSRIEKNFEEALNYYRNKVQS